MWSFSLRKPPKGQKLADDELVSQESDAFRVRKGRVRKSGQPGVCKAPADGEKGSSEEDSPKSTIGGIRSLGTLSAPASPNVLVYWSR